MKQFLKCYQNRLRLPILSTRKTIFQRRNLSYNTTLVLQMQDNAAQHTGGTVPKIAKMIHPEFFGEHVGRNPHHSENW